MSKARISGPVKIVGAGLIGTSIGLKLKELGIEVIISDSSPAIVELAVDFGAGRKASASDQPQLIIVATPPDVTAQVVIEQLSANPTAVVTDVASVKSAIAEAVAASGDAGRYVGSHPMAGREQSGVLAGRSDIFVGRPWVLTPSEVSADQAVAVIEDLALDLGGSIVRMSPAEHDRAVALVSHTPQLIASLLAAQLADSEESEVALAGQGLRDTTRIAASDPKLWIQILLANAASVSQVIGKIREDLTKLEHSLREVGATGAIKQIGELLDRGNRGVAKIPGKHGERAKKYSKITVMIDDKPGELARLLTEVGEIGVNLEDLTLEHASGAQVGLPELYVEPDAEQPLRLALGQRGWKIVG